MDSFSGQSQMGLSGYGHRLYALSLGEFGNVWELPHCGGWIIVRPIPGTTHRDGTSCYPLFSCKEWIKLHLDLADVGSSLVTLSLVTDTFCDVSRAYLLELFDLVRPFKTHYISDLSYCLESFVDKQHRYYARRSLKVMDVERSPSPLQYLDEWSKLYDNLINRHKIEGIARFSPKSFAMQLQMPGMIMFLGRHEGRIVGMNLVLIDKSVAYSHLAAYNDEGYRISASYGLYWHILSYCKEQGIRYFDFGGAAGLKDDQSDGLALFKKGWSNHLRIVYFCGRIFDPSTYDSICRSYGVLGVDYFPSYRAKVH
jgi:hypothetical protein